MKLIIFITYNLFQNFQYRFASGMDKLYIFMAILFSIVCGCMTPINTLLFSSLLQSMVNFGISVQLGDPQTQVFLDAVRDFAIYNSVVGAVMVVFSYAATVLMNIAAYNQVNTPYTILCY